jgi:hypothetical protein
MGTLGAKNLSVAPHTSGAKGTCPTCHNLDTSGGSRSSFVTFRIDSKFKMAALSSDSIRPKQFVVYNMRQVQPETLPKNSNVSSCLQNIKLKNNTT